ncbi:hypothetical protein [Micromonospora sp. NPDC051296]|uniref:hypothetical protein n=1 Tax=Micromonospora sp. NPDC051296 TaxID=3155046 RepID=UPI00342C9657
MAEVLATVSVMPLYAQVVVQSAGATDLPIPETGAEPAVASTEAVLVATRDDLDGDVSIEVRRGGDAPAPGVRVYEGELSFTTPALEVGSNVSGQLTTIDVGRIGWLPLAIFVDPPEAPSKVVVVID